MSQSDLASDDHPEKQVVVKGLERIDFVFICDSAVDLVEHVHAEIGEEYHGVHLHFVLVGLHFSHNKVVGIDEDENSKVHQAKDYRDLVDTLNDNISPHLLFEDLGLSANSSFFFVFLDIGAFNNWLSTE